MTPEYHVDLEIFSGPLDLLLYLIRRHELDVADVSVAQVTDQYLEYVGVLEQIDADAAGDFLVVAATLLEMKSRSLLPTPPVDVMDDAESATSSTLVRELLEYKRFRDVAAQLGAAADERAKRFRRAPAELPAELRGVELEEVHLWDLVSAFGRVMTSIGARPLSHAVEYDDTPIELHASELVAALERSGPQRFDELFARSTQRTEVVGLFLALLDLIKRRRVRAEQPANFAQIYLVLLEPVEDEEREGEAAADEGSAAPDGSRPDWSPRVEPERDPNDDAK